MLNGAEDALFSQLHGQCLFCVLFRARRGRFCEPRVIGASCRLASLLDTVRGPEFRVSDEWVITADAFFFVSAGGFWFFHARLSSHCRDLGLRSL
jgi:hypothetical protein